MRTVFIGAVEFSDHALNRLLSTSHGAEIVGVCTLREAPNNADHRDLSTLARECNVPCVYAPMINSSESIEWIRARRPDAIFCFGWSRLLSPDLLALAPRGVVGFHPASLPANRGRHPLVWALALGLSETASTFFLMDHGADTGPILHQRKVPISYEDNARTLYSKVTATALSQLEDWVPMWTAGKLEPQPQDQATGNAWRKRGKSDGKIDWRIDSRGIYNLVRSLTRPYVGAHFLYGEREVKVWRCEEFQRKSPENIEPGKVLEVGPDGPVVKTGTGAVRLCEMEPHVKLQPGGYL